MTASAVIVPVPDAEPLVGGWREQYDPAAADGMPAHITALHPFLETDALSDAVVRELRQLCAELAPLEIAFQRIGGFPGVTYLAPEPPDELRALTLAIEGRWPDHPPYGGQFDDVVPHLTVAMRDDLREIEPALFPQLPLVTMLPCAALWVLVDGRWSEHASLPFERQRASSA